MEDKVDVTTFREELNKIQQQEESTQSGNEDDTKVAEQDTSDKSEDSNDTDKNLDNDDTNSPPDTDDSDDELDIKNIPYKRFNKEIQRRKALEAELQKEREERIRAKTELELIDKALKNMSPKQQQEAPTEPVDPYMQAINNVNKRMDEQEYRRNFETVVNAQHQHFTKENPDFDSAYMHLIKTEVEANKYFYDDENQAKAAAMQKIKDISDRAFRQGKNIPEILYNLARQYGHQKQVEPKKQTNLDAIERNMAKSKTYDSNAAALPPSDKANNYTVLENFEKVYDPKNPNSVEEFHKMLEAARRRK